MFRSLPLIVALALLGWAFWSSETVADIASGVALFLFGMMALEQGLRGLTGGTLERLLRLSTDRLWKGLTFGAASTALTQSSTLVSLLTISFLSSGLLGLQQGLGVIFGANLGTTTGAWLMAGPALHFNIGRGALPMLTFGVVFILTRQVTLRSLGWVLVGIGFLFLGIQWMKDGFEAFQQAFDLTAWTMTGWQGLVVYTAIGIFATVIMQSSHATLILTITALAAGQIGYENALAISIGANIGTAVSTGLAAITANIEGRRLAGAHLLFNLVTAAVALLLITPFMLAVEWLAGLLSLAEENHAVRLAIFHTLFNLAGILIMVPLIPSMVRVLERVFRSKPAPASKPRYIGKAVADIPGPAMEAARKELVRLFGRIFKIIATSLNYEPAELRNAVDREKFKTPPHRVRSHDLDALYQERVKPLHGLIVDFLARVPVRGERARQLVMMRTSSQRLLESVKDTKHLQKNMVRYLRSSNPGIRGEYLAIRANLGELLQRLEALSRDPGEDLELSLGELAARAETNDIVTNGHLDQLIRDRAITAEQATSLMNDSAYAYRIASNLIAAARALFLPFEELDAELREELALESGELRDILQSSDETSRQQGGHSP
ncbi:Na/Pi cotransporter family protein [Wenzhouxiangella sp. AB-CW3]|uniref:Na/Pi cotransporter family protein n=1 Tax=Wenzhouxiangella sp. AB-CW3 TaxID=2771012 RepID=UPI00168C0C10|nr:Na/Pi symporter [Wenzhouxiangella sp. AB-CW3]QOC22622.1 Na/Pi cotransporter family protein [Wenzhouxiangella sp. AB-CW3]